MAAGAAPGDLAEAAWTSTAAAALITMRRATYDDEGVAVEHGTHVYHSSRVQLLAHSSSAER